MRVGLRLFIGNSKIAHAGERPGEKTGRVGFNSLLASKILRREDRLKVGYHREKVEMSVQIRRVQHVAQPF